MEEVDGDAHTVPRPQLGCPACADRKERLEEMIEKYKETFFAVHILFGFSTKGYPSNRNRPATFSELVR